MAFKINGPIRNGEANPVWQATATIFQIADPVQQLRFASVYLLPKRQLLAPGTALAQCQISQIKIALGDQSYTWKPDRGNRPTALLLLQFPPDGWSKNLADPELTPPDCTCLAGEIPVWSTDTRWQDHFQPAVYFSADPAALTVHSSGISFTGRPKVPWDYRTPLATPVRWNVMLPFVQNVPIGPRPPLYLEIDRCGLPPEAVGDLIATFSSLSSRLPTDARWAQLALPSQSLAQPGIPVFSWTITPIFGGQPASGWFKFGQGEVTLRLTDKVGAVAMAAPGSIADGEVTLRLTDKVGSDPGATGNQAIASPDVTFSVPDAQGNIRITLQSGAAPGPDTGAGVYSWSAAAETLHFTKLEASYDPVEAARRLRSQFSLSEPDPDQDVQPLLLWGCVPLEDGWAQLPFFNVTDSIFAKVFPDLGTSHSLQSGPLAGVVSWGNEDKPGTGEQAWSASLLGVDGLSGIFELPGDGTKIQSFTLEFVNPSLELNGFLWLATDPPSAADALPTFDNWLRAVTMLPLRSCDPTDPNPPPYSAKFANLDLQAGPDGSAVPTGWTFELSANANSDAMTNLTKPGGPFDKVPAKLKATPPLVWRRHPALPNVQTLPYTQALDPPVNPSTSRQLAPFTLSGDSWTFTSRAANVAKRWPVLSGNQAPVSDVALACLSLPGLRFDASPGPIAPTVFASADGDPARSWLSAHYRYGLPYADEIYALSQVGKQNSSNANATGAAAFTREDYDAFRATMQAKAALAEAQGDEAISAGPPVEVQGLVEPMTWPVSPALEETAYPGSLTLTDSQGGTALVLTRDTALAGFQGGFNAVDPRTLTRAADAAPATWQVIGGCLMAQGSQGAIRDQRGLIRSASSTFNPGPGNAGTTGVHTPLTTPDGKAWLLTSLRQSLSLAIDAGTSWDFWFRDLPVASDMTFVRDRSRSKAARGVNDPAAFSSQWTHLNGYEWRMGSSGKADGLPLLGFSFDPLTLESVTFAADGSIAGLEVLGRLLFQWSSQATENGRANAVIVTFRLDPATGSLTLSSVRADNGDPDRDAQAIPVPAGYKGEWALTPDTDPNPARLYWNDVALQSGALVPGGAVLDFFFWGARWQVAIPLASANGQLSGNGAIPPMAGAVIATEVGLTVDPAADPSKTSVASITIKLAYRWGDTNKVFLNAEETCVVVGPKPVIPNVAISLHGPTAVILPLSVDSAQSQNGSVQIGFSADMKNTVPKLWQLLPGMFLSETDPIKGFATMTFSLNGLTGPNGPANQTPIAMRAAFAEILFRSEWGKSLQEPGDAIAAEDLYASSAGNIVAGYSCNYDRDAATWTDTLLLNGLLEVRNVISWPLPQQELDSHRQFHIPSVGDLAPLEHARHTIRVLFDQHEFPADGLVCGGPNQIFTLAGDRVWKTLAITEHQLVNITSDAVRQAADLPLKISADRRWTVVQPLRFFGTTAFNRWLGNFMSPCKTAFAIADRVNETEFKQASALYGGRILELLPDEVLKLHDGLIVEASGAGWVRQQPATAVFSPLEFLPGSTPGGAFMNPNDLGTPFGVQTPQWCLASVPFLGRLLPTPQTPRSLLCYDPIDYLNQVRAGGGHVEPLPLRFANRTDRAAFDIALSSFDLPGNHAFQRLDTASLEESLFRLSTPPAEAPDRELSSVLSTMPSNGPGRLGRPAVLNRVYDARRYSLPPANPAFTSASAQQIEQFFQIQGFATGAQGYTAFIAGALLLSANFVQASGAGPSYFPAAWLIAPDIADNPEPVTVAVSPYLGLKRFKVVGEDTAVLVSGELLGTRTDGQLDVLARQSWMPPNAEDPAAFQSWATSILQLTAPDSQAAVLRLRRLVAGKSEDATRTATVEYLFQCLPVGFTPPLALTTHPIRTRAARLRFAEGHYGGSRMPDPLLDFEVAPPQVRDVQPVRLEKRPASADSPAGPDWPWGVSALRMRVRYAGSSDRPIGVAAGVVVVPADADDAVVWWQGASQTAQFQVGEEIAYQLPPLFRAAPIQSLTPAMPNPALPPLPRAPEAPENPLADPPSPDDYWQSLLPGTADYLIDGSRPGAGFVLRNHLQRQTGDSVVISGGLPVQHRMVRPVPLRKNNKDLRDVALRSWAGYFDPEALLVAKKNPTGTAFVAPGIDDKIASHQPEQLRATLVSPAAGTIPATWDGSVEIEFEGKLSDTVGWKVDVQVETASGVLVLKKGQDDSHYAPPPEIPPATPGSKLAAIVGPLHHGDPVVIVVTAEYVDEPGGLVTVKGYRQRIEFDLLLSKPERPPLPFRPVYTVFEDPEYNRALVSQTAYAEGLWLAQKTQHRIRLAFDRREYNASSSFAALYEDEDAPESLKIGPPLGAVLSLKLIRADGTTVRLGDIPSEPGTVIQGSLPKLFEARGISPASGDSIAGTLIPLADPPVLVQSIATVLVAIVEAPVMPAPQAAYGLLRKNKDAVSCVRFAWSPAATSIELVNPDDLRGETVRRRASFSWRDTVRPAEDYWYGVQKLAPNGSTHSIEHELWIKPDGSGDQE